MDEVGREFGFEGDESSLRRRDAHDCFGAVGLACGGSVEGGSSRCSVGAGAMSSRGGATRSDNDGCLDTVFPGEATEREVWDEMGETATEVSGAVEVAEVVSVQVEEGTSVRSSGVGVGAWSGRTSVGGGEGGGEGRQSAPWMTSCGGQARGEMMIPGAVEGLDGRCDQMTYSLEEMPVDFGNAMVDAAGDGGREGDW